jgi:hypothetical protein
MLFNRTASLVIGQSGGKGIEVAGLRIAFNIEKTSTETLNNSTIEIYNLSPDSQKLIETPNNAVILKAGYTEDVGAQIIFTGIVRRSLTVRSGPDWITKLELDDGLLAYRDSKESFSFQAGVSGVGVLKSVAASFNLPVRQFPTGIKDKSYPAGFSFVGRVREAMTNVCNYLGLEWSIQNQEIQIIKKGGTTQRTAIVLSEDTGMIGSPALEAKTLSDKAAAKQGITVNSAGVIQRRKENVDGEIDTKLEVQGYTVVSLLQPTLEPGSVVQLKARGIDGIFMRVEKLNHKGDTHGTEWYSELSLRFI